MGYTKISSLNIFRNLLVHEENKFNMVALVVIETNGSH